MQSSNQNPKELLAKGNLESALETLVRLTQHADDADLRQRVLTLRSQFARLKKQHLTGVLEHKDYQREINRITAAAAEVVDNLPVAGVPKIQLDSKERSPFWRTWRFWAWFIPVLLAALEAMFGALSYLVQSANPSEKKVSPVTRTSSDTGCGFPSTFDSTQLYVLITRFEDNANVDVETKCYGEEIASRIEQISIDSNLAIKVCYVDTEPPLLIEDAVRMREQYHADIIIWGKLRDLKEDCFAGGFCLKFRASDTLSRYAGKETLQKVDNEYQANISSQDIEEGLIKMGAGSFTSWVIGMFNLKIGRNKPEFYRIASDLPDSAKAGEYATRGDLFSSLGLYEKTIADYSQAIRLVSHPLFYNNRAVAYEKLGQLQLSISDCDHAIQLDSNFAQAYHTRGYANLKLGFFELAISDFNRTIQLNPNDFGAYIDRGGAKHHLGQVESAIADYDKAILFNPNQAGAFNNRGAAKAGLKQYEAALSDYDKAIELDPKYSTGYYNRGQLKRDLGKHQEAVVDLAKAIQLDSTNLNAYDIRGASNYDMGLYRDALADLDKYIRYDTSNDGVYSVRGYCKSKLGLEKEAIAEYDKAIQLTPSDPISYDNRGVAKTKIGDYAGAIVDFDKAIQLAPKDIDYYFNRGLAKDGIGQYKAAIEDFNMVFKIEPNAESHNERGVTKIKLGLYQEGIADFNSALKTNPNDSRAYNNRGDAHWKQGKYFAAMADFWQSFRARYLPGWRLHTAWVLLAGPFIFWRFGDSIKNYIQSRKQRAVRKTTRQEKRHPKKMKNR